MYQIFKFTTEHSQQQIFHIKEETKMGVFAGSTLSFNQREITKDANFFASGGTITEITQNGVVYRVHSFTTTGSSTLTVNRLLKNCEYLIVAGGGAGGNGGCNAGSGSGGGAGGLLTGTTIITSQSYTITVGPGATSPGAGNSPNNGVNSSALGFTAIGGGGGGVATAGCTTGSSISNGNSGGSGGGAQSYYGTTYQGGAGTLEQGNPGGLGKSYQTLGNNYLSGGGGGAGGPGETPINGAGPSATGAAGGAGISSIISGTLTFYAGGGRGGVYTGTQSQNSLGNSIGGGGNAGGNGSSGIVIIRYPIGVVGQ
jgi:hypothetical protein